MTFISAVERKRGARVDSISISSISKAWHAVLTGPVFDFTLPVADGGQGRDDQEGSADLLNGEQMPHSGDALHRFAFGGK
jgi:hypothetical protein